MKNRNIIYLICCFLLIGIGCNNEMKVSSKAQIEQKVEALLELMTLEEKIGQMSQIRHFEESADKHVTEKFIGSIIHTQGPNPGKNRFRVAKEVYKTSKEGAFYKIGYSFIICCRCCSWSKYF